MNTLTEPNIIVKDLEGHRYSIPENMKDEFQMMKESIILAEWGSDEWYNANDDLNDTFGQYMKDE